jgi:hypothetical protein
MHIPGCTPTCSGILKTASSDVPPPVLGAGQVRIGVHCAGGPHNHWTCVAATTVFLFS